MPSKSPPESAIVKVTRLPTYAFAQVKALNERETGLKAKGASDGFESRRGRHRSNAQEISWAFVVTATHVQRPGIVKYSMTLTRT